MPDWSASFACGFASEAEAGRVSGVDVPDPELFSFLDAIGLRESPRLLDERVEIGSGGALVRLFPFGGHAGSFGGSERRPGPLSPARRHEMSLAPPLAA